MSLGVPLLLLLLSVPQLKGQLFSNVVKDIRCICRHVSIHQTLLLDINCTSPGDAVISSRASNDTALEVKKPNYCLTRLPTNIGNFPGIVSIDLRSNSISELPSLSNLTRLQYADFSYNQIQRLHRDVFAGLERLCFLDLRNNRIHTIDLGVFHPGLVSLNYTDLSYNQLTSIEPWPMILSHPFCLFSVAHNKISRITNREGWKMNNRVFFNYGGVDLSYNNFTRWVGDSFKALGILSVFDYAAFINWGFDFDNNPWQCDCKLYDAVKLAQGGLAKAWYRSYLPVLCAGPPHFRGKIFTDLPLSELVCNVSQDCPQGCFCQDQPHHARMLVNCSGAGLQALPASLPPGPLHLQLQHNRIAQLGPAAYLARVVELHLSHNDLVSLSPEAAVLLRGVRVLDVAHNRLRYLPRQLQGLPPGALRLEHNPLQCRCNSSWLGQWLRNVRAALGPTLLNQSSPTLLELTCQLQDGQIVPAIQETVRSLGCQEPRRPLVLDALLGTGLLLLLLLLLLALVFRYELLVLLHRHRGSWRRPGRDGPDLAYDWFLSVESEDEADRLWAGQELRPTLENVRGLRLYIPFIHHTVGGVAADETMAAIQQSRGAIVLLSSSYASSRPRSFEFTHLYKVMASKGQGPIRVIKHPGVTASSVANGYLRAMVRLKMYLDFDDEALVSKVVETRESP